MQTKIFEILMLLSFGAAWPASIMRSYKARTAKGKSLIFLLIIEFGYICGIINKLINEPNYVMYLYVLNFLMVFFFFLLYFRNTKIDKIAEYGMKGR